MRSNGFIEAATAFWEEIIPEVGSGVSVVTDEEHSLVVLNIHDDYRVAGVSLNEQQADALIIALAKASDAISKERPS